MRFQSLRPHRLLLPIASLLSVVVATFGVANAETYPSRPIKLIVSTSAGGAGDAAVRVFAPIFSKLMEGVPVVVENRPGANGVLAVQATIGSKPDGYTICMCASGTISISPLMVPNIGYDPAKDLQPVTQFFGVNGIIVARPSSVTSFAQLIENEKKAPGALKYGSNGIGGSTNLGMEATKLVTGMHLVHVPYGGEPQVLAALLGGEVDIGDLSVFAAKSLVSQGGIPLAATGLARSPEFPDVPTIAEQGFPGFQFGSWTGMFVKADTPPDIAKIYAASEEAMSAAEFQQNLRKSGLDPVLNQTPEQFAAFIKAETETWKKVLANVGADGKAH